MKVRAALRDAEAKGQELDYTYVVTGPFAYGYLGAGHVSPELGAYDVKKKAAVLLGDGKGKISIATPPEYVPCIAPPDPADIISQCRQTYRESITSS